MLKILNLIAHSVILLSMLYKCVIVDDNMIDRDAVEMHLRKMDCIEIVAVCKNGMEASNLLNSTTIDIVLSDIDMPDLNGIELLQSQQKPPVFIFISSYSEYAAESYNLDVIDFIVKPATLSRLVKAVNKAIEYIELKKVVERAHERNAGDQTVNVDIHSSEEYKDYFYVKENYDYSRIANADVIYIESMGNFSRIRTVQNKKHITLVSLKKIESQLPPKDFMRVQKQFIINLNHIISIASNGDIILTGDNSVPLSSIYKNALMDVINKRILLR